MRFRGRVLITLFIGSLLTSACMGEFLPPFDQTSTAFVDMLRATGAALTQQAAYTPQSESLEVLVSNPSIATPTIPPTPIQTLTPIATATSSLANTPPLLYYTQAGDTLPTIAIRFGVNPSEITSPESIPETSLLNPNQLLIIPRRLANTTSAHQILPDSEIVYSPSAADFDVSAFVEEAGGYLSRYEEPLNSIGMASGAEVVASVALNNSINPRLLLALLEYQSGWVFGQPENMAQVDYPLGYIHARSKGLYRQLAWAVNQLSIGYYGWREGLLTELHFRDGVIARIAPDLNAGSVSLQYFFSQIADGRQWVQALLPETGFYETYESMFGNPWVRSMDVEPLYPPDLTQPELILPFLGNQVWSYTGGPHGAWEHDGARAALDFAPASDEPGCGVSETWTVASAPGLVIRSGHGIVVLDLDGDGIEQTGWVLLYLHITTDGMIPEGEWLDTGDLIGHPSCEGGIATGTHLHIARKYNGEWIPADGPLPFVLDGWTAHSGQEPYEGSLTRNGQIITANSLGTADTLIWRPQDE